jgi:glycosyltransferase involved in cell wall biosynthesis
MEIIIVNDHSSLVGGAARVAISGAVGLRRLGIKVTYFSGKGPADAELIESGAQLVCLNQAEFLQRSNKLKASATGLRNQSACRALKALLATKDPSKTIVHYHTWVKVLSPAILRIAQACGFRSVLTLHDFFITCPNGVLINHQTNQICKLKPLSGQCLSTHCDSRSFGHKCWRSLRGLYQAHAVKPYETIDKILAVSELCREKVIEGAGAEARIDVLLNPVDLAPASPAPVEQNKHFVFVGRLSPEKGLHVLLDAIHGTDLKVRIIGEGPIAADHNLTNVEWLGWLSPENVMAEIRQARALVFPSIWYETFGLTAFEAMAHGVPVVVSDCTATAGYIEDGVTGLHFRRGDATQLRQLLSALNQSPELATKIGTHAFNWFKKSELDLDSHIKTLLRVYEDLISVTH